MLTQLEALPEDARVNSSLASRAALAPLTEGFKTKLTQRPEFEREALAAIEPRMLALFGETSVANYRLKLGIWYAQALCLRAHISTRSFAAIERAWTNMGGAPLA